MQCIILCLAQPRVQLEISQEGLWLEEDACGEERRGPKGPVLTEPCASCSTVGVAEGWHASRNRGQGDAYCGADSSIRCTYFVNPHHPIVVSAQKHKSAADSPERPTDKADSPPLPCIQPLQPLLWASLHAAGTQRAPNLMPCTPLPLVP